MKRYLVFAGDQYYPAGGWEDFMGAFVTLEEAQDYYEKLTGTDWKQLVDLETQTVLKQI